MVLVPRSVGVVAAFPAAPLRASTWVGVDRVVFDDLLLTLSVSSFMSPLCGMFNVGVTSRLFLDVQL